MFDVMQLPVPEPTLPWPDIPHLRTIGHFLAQPPSGRAMCVGVHPQYHYYLLPDATPFGETERK
jgi:hypothetical protein